MSPAPATTPNADAVYARLAPVATQDAGLGWPLLTYIVGLCEMFKRVEETARSINGAPAYAQLLDIDNAPDYALPYLGQFPGVTLLGGSTPAEQRTRIQSTDGFKRGTPAAIIAAVKATLTGTQFVALVERAGGVESALQVSVRTSETPNPAATLKAAIAAKRWGLILSLVVTAAVTWGEMELRNPVGAWTSVEAQFATYAAAEAVV